MQNLWPDQCPNWFRNAKKIALAEWIKNYDFERSAIYLFDPNANRLLDKLLLEEVLKPAVKALENVGFTVLSKTKPHIEQKYFICACRELYISIQDPKRPSAPGNYPPCHCRLTVWKTKKDNFFMEDYFSIYLPKNTKFEFLQDLLAETSGSGIPSALSISSDEPQRYYHVTFNRGGSGQGINAYKSTSDRVRDKMLLYCGFIDIAYELEDNMNDRLLHRKLIHQINDIYES